MGFNEHFVLTANSKLCSDHFEENSFSKSNNERGRILSESVPTKFDRYYLQCVCCNNIKTIGCNVCFRKFPFKNKELFKKWVINIGQENFLPNERSLICDEHFEKHCFYKGKAGYTTLKATAVPTLFDKNIYRDSADAEVVPVDSRNDPIETHLDRNNAMTAMLIQNLSCTEEVSSPKRYKSDSVSCDELIQTDADNISMEIDYACNEDLQRSHVSRRLKTPESPETAQQSDKNHDLQTSHISRSPKTPEMTETPLLSDINHDHHYHSTPRGLNKRYNRMRQRLEESRTESYVQKQQIKRLQKKITTLSDIVSELRRTRAVPENGLACLNTIIQSDVSQLMDQTVDSLRKNDS